MPDSPAPRPRLLRWRRPEGPPTAEQGATQSGTEASGRRSWVALSLQQKAWLMTAGVLAGLAGLLGLGVHVVFHQATQEIEARWVAESVRRTQAALRAEIDALERSARDYSMWSDTYEFVADGNQAYVEHNLLPSMFANLQLDAFLVFDVNGAPLLARAYEGGVVMGDGLEALTAALAPLARGAAREVPGSPPKGLVEVDGEVVLFGILPVLRDDGSGPPRGALAHVRYLRPGRVGHLRDTVNLDLALEVPHRPIPAGAADSPTLSQTTMFATQPISESLLRVTIPLRDVEARVIGAWQLTLPREIYQHGVQTRTVFYLVIGALIVAATLLIGWMLRWMVIARLEALLHAVRRVESTGDLTLRLPVRGTDELASLTDATNRMWSTLAQGEADRLKAEREREQLNAQLQEAQKMDAIGTLAGGLAHDFNNLLTSIQGSVTMLRADCPAGDGMAANIERIEKATQRAVRLVQQMMAFSRRGPASYRPVQLRQVVQDALHLVGPSLPRGLRIDVKNQARDDWVRADTMQLQQVLINLATNSSHAMAAGDGRITITLQSVRLPEAGRSDTVRLPAGEYVRLSFADTGCGIPAAHLPRVFEPFYTTKPMGAGTGLGLAVAHGIVTSHGGAISIESEVGCGTTVHIHLPVAHENDVTAEPPSITTASPVQPAQGMRLLLVDDDAMVRETLEMSARRLGYHVSAAASAAEAMSLFETDPMAFDAVVSDQMMPGGTGMELGERLRRVRPDVPLFLITGYAASLNEASVKARGFSAMLMKPVTMAEVDQAIRTATRRIV